IFVSLWELVVHPGDFSHKVATDNNIKLSGFILLSMIPALVVGLSLKETIETVFLNPFMVSIMLLVTGSILYITKFCNSFTKHIDTSRAFGIEIGRAS